MTAKRPPFWRRWFGFSEHAQPVHTPPETHATFQVFLKHLKIGDLELDKGHWKFAYSDTFRQQKWIRPIPDFPDVQKTYTSAHLWPFFFMRIPSLKQSDIQAIVDAEAIDSTDEVELLRRFGKRTVANPFELVEAN